MEEALRRYSLGSNFLTGFNILRALRSFTDSSFWGFRNWGNIENPSSLFRENLKFWILVYLLLKMSWNSDSFWTEILWLRRGWIFFCMSEIGQAYKIFWCYFIYLLNILKRIQGTIHIERNYSHYLRLFLLISFWGSFYEFNQICNSYCGGFQ